MDKEKIGLFIKELRKEKNQTQRELAEKIHVTDKAVSKWERDLSAPDVNSIPKLAETFGVTVDELMQVKTETKENISHNKIDEIIDTALKGIGVAMGVAVAVLAIMDELPVNTALIFLGIGLASISISMLKER